MWQKIKHLYYWFPIIWDDRNWDWSYILIILNHKLKSVLDRWEKNQMYIGQSKDTKKIRICTLLLNRLIKDDYILNHEGDMVDYMQQQDKDYLLKLLEKHLFKWWD